MSTYRYSFVWIHTVCLLMGVGGVFLGPLGAGAETVGKTPTGTPPDAAERTSATPTTAPSVPSVVVETTAQTNTPPANSPAGNSIAPALPLEPSTPKPVKDAPPPEVLNPGANPLLFPTTADEVQIRNFQRITLQQAIELARRNNRDIRIGGLTIEGSRAAVREALAAEFPSIGMTADFTRSESNNIFSSSAAGLNLGQLNSRSRSNTSTSFGTGLNLSYDLYTSGLRPARIRAAEEQLRSDQLDLERQVEEVRLDVTNAYYDLQEADAQVDIALASVREANRSLRDAQLREQAGLGTQFDILQAQVQLANSTQDLVRARSQQSISRRQIARILGLAQTAEVAAAEQIQEAGTWNLTLEQSIIQALQNRAELPQQLAQRNIQEAQRRIALAQNRPQVTLAANYGIEGELGDGVGPGDNFTLAARLRWDFYDGGAARARANQAIANRSIAETRFSDRRDQIRFEVEQSYFNLQSNRDNIQTARLAVEQAQQALDLARLRFEAGVGTQTDVISAQTELTRAQVNLLRAVLDYNRSLAALQRAVSNLPDSRLADRP